MEKILYAVWKYWALLVFITISIFALPIMGLLLLLFPFKFVQNLCNNIFKTGGYIALLLTGIIPVFEGDFKALKKHKKYVYVANHRSYLDILIGVIFTSANTRFLSKIEVFNWPIIGFFTTKLGHIPVDRSNPKARYESLQNIKQNVRDGKSLILFPEGRILKNTDLLNTFKNGAFATAIETQTPIMCMTLLNAGIICPSHTTVKVKPGILRIKYSEPILTEGMTKDDIYDLKEIVYNEMEKNLTAYYPDKKYPLK